MLRSLGHWRKKMSLILDMRLSIKYLHFGLRLRSPKTWWWKPLHGNISYGGWRKGWQYNPHFGPIEPNIFWSSVPQRWKPSMSISIDIGRYSFRFHPFTWRKETQRAKVCGGSTSTSIWRGPFWYYHSWLTEGCR